MSQVQLEETLTLQSPPSLSTTERVLDMETTLREITRALGFLKSNPSWWTRIYTECFQVVNAMAKGDEPQPQLCNLLQASFELALSVDKDYVLKLAGEEADAFMCLLQKAIDFTPPGHKSRAHFMKILMDVAIHSHVFPRILTLDDITDRSEHPLYAGGFGDVWRASWRGRSVALKSPRLTLVVNDADRAHRNLCREVLLWRQLNHPHLLEFLGVCKYSSPYTSIVSPWMENGTLLNFVQARPKVGRINLLKQVASALSYLHEHDPPVVHQDVRCINILVNDNQEAVLGDFGLSRIDNNFFTSMASTMQHGCTRWQAPELLFPPSGEMPSTSWATDMWSFGMVVLELFTERLPFAKTAVDSAVIIDIYHGRKPDRPVDSEVKAPGLSDRVWACVEKCWAKSPSERPRASVLVSLLTEELAAENTTSVDDVPDAISAQGFSRHATPSLVATLWRSVTVRRKAPSRVCPKPQTVHHGALRVGEPTQMVKNYVILVACSICCMVWLGLLAIQNDRRHSEVLGYWAWLKSPVRAQTVPHGALPFGELTQMVNLYAMLVACTITCMVWLGRNHSEQFLSRKDVRKANDEQEQPGTVTFSNPGEDQIDQSLQSWVLVKHGRGHRIGICTPVHSRSPSVHLGPEVEGDHDLFDGYSFKGRNSILVDDDDEPEDVEEEFEDTEAAMKRGRASLKLAPEGGETHPNRRRGCSPTPTPTESSKISPDMTERPASTARHSKLSIRLPFGKYKKRAKKDPEPSLSSTPYSPMLPHYAPAEPNYALTPANYSPSSPSYSLSGNYTPAAPNLPPSLPRGGSALVQGSNDDLKFRQPATFTHPDFSFQLTNDFTSELAISFEPQASIIFVDIPKAHFEGVVGENSCNITKLVELHGVTITRYHEEVEAYILMKLQGSPTHTQRAKEEILKVIEFQDLFGAFMAGKTCI